MKYMYVNYKSNMRESFITDENITRHDYAHITQQNTSETSSSSTQAFDEKCDIKIQNTYSSDAQGKVINMKSYIKAKEETINEEITQFFFDSIHKNYRKNRL